MSYRYPFALLVCLSIAADPARCAAAFLVPDLSSEYFGWDRGDANSTFSGWDILEDALPPNDPSAGFTDATPDVAGQSGAPGSLSVGPGAIPVGSGNAYSPFAALQFQSTIPSGTAGSHTRIVAQFRTGGSELAYANVLLSLDPSLAGTIEPSFAVELDRTTLGGFGGDQVDYLAVWDLASVQDAVRIDFGAAESSLSLSEFQVDSFTQDQAFTTPASVPEPNSIAISGLVVAGLAVGRRRRMIGNLA